MEIGREMESLNSKGHSHIICMHLHFAHRHMHRRRRVAAAAGERAPPSAMQQGGGGGGVVGVGAVE